MQILLKIEEDYGLGTFAAKAWGDIKRCRYNFDTKETQKLLVIGNYILVEEHDNGNIKNCTNEHCLNRKSTCACDNIVCHEMSIIKARNISEAAGSEYIKNFK